MFKLSSLLYGRYLPLVLLLLALSGLVSLGGCSKALPLLLGGGPKIAANVQGGKTNSQTVGYSGTSAPSVSVRPNARVENVDQSNDTVNDTNPIVWVVFGLLLAGAMYLLYLLPSPHKEKS